MENREAEKDQQQIKPYITPHDIANAICTNSGDRTFTTKSTNSGLHILDTTKPGEDWITQRVVHVGLNDRGDGKVNIFADDKSMDIAAFVQALGVRAEKTGDCNYAVNMVSYKDIPAPTLQGIGEHNGEPLYFKQGRVKVFGSKQFPDNIYVYQGKNQLARIKLDAEHQEVIDVQRLDYVSFDLLKLALATIPDIPFREHIMRRYHISSDSPDIREIAEKAQKVKQRLNRLREVYAATRLPDWKMTDSTQHDPDNFRYIVHMIASQYTVSSLGLFRTQARRDGFDSEGTEGTAIDNPQGFLSRQCISASVIDQLHTHTWSTTGVILKVPEENIILASPQDIGSFPLKSSGYKRQIPPPASSILSQTRFGSYNEILIHGTNPETGVKTEIIGYIIVVDPISGKPIDHDAAVKIVYYARNKTRSIIEIPEQIDL